MPLACLEEVRDPSLFEEVLRFHYMYFSECPDIARNYVEALTAKSRVAGKFQKKESTWKGYLLARLDREGKTFSQIRSELSERNQRKTAFVSLDKLVKEGVVERLGSKYEYKYRLK